MTDGEPIGEWIDRGWVPYPIDGPVYASRDQVDKPEAPAVPPQPKRSRKPRAKPNDPSFFYG